MIQKVCGHDNHTSICCLVIQIIMYSVLGFKDVLNHLPIFEYFNYLGKYIQKLLQTLPITLNDKLATMFTSDQNSELKRKKLCNALLLFEMSHVAFAIPLRGTAYRLAYTEKLSDMKLESISDCICQVITLDEAQESLIKASIIETTETLPSVCLLKLLDTRLADMSVAINEEIKCLAQWKQSFTCASALDGLLKIRHAEVSILVKQIEKLSIISNAIIELGNRSSYTSAKFVTLWNELMLDALIGFMPSPDGPRIIEACICFDPTQQDQAQIIKEFFEDGPLEDLLPILKTIFECLIIPFDKGGGLTESNIVTFESIVGGGLLSASPPNILCKVIREINEDTWRYIIQHHGFGCPIAKKLTLVSVVESEGAGDPISPSKRGVISMEDVSREAGSLCNYTLSPGEPACHDRLWLVKQNELGVALNVGCITGFPAVQNKPVTFPIAYSRLVGVSQLMLDEAKRLGRYITTVEDSQNPGHITAEDRPRYPGSIDDEHAAKQLENLATIEPTIGSLNNSTDTTAALFDCISRTRILYKMTTRRVVPDGSWYLPAMVVRSNGDGSSVTACLRALNFYGMELAGFGSSNSSAEFWSYAITQKDLLARVTPSRLDEGGGEIYPVIFRYNKFLKLIFSAIMGSLINNGTIDQIAKFNAGTEYVFNIEWYKNRDRKGQIHTDSVGQGIVYHVQLIWDTRGPQFSSPELVPGSDFLVGSIQQREYFLKKQSEIDTQTQLSKEEQDPMLVLCAEAWKTHESQNVEDESSKTIPCLTPGRMVFMSTASEGQGIVYSGLLDPVVLHCTPLGYSRWLASAWFLAVVGISLAKTNLMDTEHLRNIVYDGTMVLPTNPRDPLVTNTLHVIGRWIKSIIQAYINTQRQSQGGFGANACCKQIKTLTDGILDPENPIIQKYFGLDSGENADKEIEKIIININKWNELDPFYLDLIQSAVIAFVQHFPTTPDPAKTVENSRLLKIAAMDFCDHITCLISGNALFRSAQPAGGAPLLGIQERVQFIQELFPFSMILLDPRQKRPYGIATSEYMTGEGSGAERLERAASGEPVKEGVVPASTSHVASTYSRTFIRTTQTGSKSPVHRLMYLFPPSSVSPFGRQSWMKERAGIDADQRQRLSFEERMNNPNVIRGGVCFETKPLTVTVTASAEQPLERTATVRVSTGAVVVLDINNPDADPFFEFEERGVNQADFKY